MTQNQLYKITKGQAEISERQKEASGSLREINRDVNALLANQFRALQLAEESRSREQAHFEGVANSLKHIHTTVPSRSSVERSRLVSTALEDRGRHLQGTNFEVVVAFW